MRADDLQDQNSERAKAIHKLQALCDTLGLSYSYTEANFRIRLPFIPPTHKVDFIKESREIDTTMQELIDQGLAHEVEAELAPSIQQNVYQVISGTSFDAQGWPTSPIDESHHDPEQPLQEGEAPDAL